MNPRITLLSAVLLIPILSSCSSITNLFGPTPNKELVTLAAHEQREGRGDIADSLFAEVSRLCGFTEDGTVPETCQVDRAEAVAELGLGQNPSLLEAKVPQESRPLVISLAVKKAAQNVDLFPVLSPDAQLSKTDLEQAQQLLELEQQVVWAFNFSLAFAGNAEEKERLERLILLHENAMETLEDVVSAPKASAAGYQSGEIGLPKTSEDTPGFISQLSLRTQQAYEQAAVAAAPATQSTQTTDATPTDTGGAGTGAATATGWLQWLINNAARNNQAQS